MNDDNLTPPGEGVDSRFPWTGFYEAVADGLMAYRDQTKRVGLLAEICEFDPDLKKKNQEENMDDICPFSVMARFNRERPGDPKRLEFAENLASLLGITESAPETFSHVGIPTVNRSSTVFFAHRKENRKDGDVDTMWEVFACALDLAKSDRAGTRAAFIRSYDKALDVKWVGAFKLAIGLYWIRPWFFLPLDKNSRGRIEKELGVPVDVSDGESYLALRDKLAARFKDESCPVRSFPELARLDQEPKASRPGT